MKRLKPIAFFSLASILAFLISLSPLFDFAAQFIALSSILIIIYSLKKKNIPLYIITFTVTLIVLFTNGLNSPLFFLIYFLLFIIAFQNPPTVTLSYSLVLIFILSGSLNSFSSLIPLLSLLLITPLAAFVSNQYLENKHLNDEIGFQETEILLWYSLKFKKFINQISNSAEYILANKDLSPDQKKELYKIKNHAKDLLESSSELTREIENE